MSQSNIGLLLAALSSLVFALCSLVTKHLSQYHPCQLCFYSFFCIVLISAACSVKERIFPRGVYKLILVRSICGTVFFVSSFYAIQVMPLGDASVLLYTAPVWTLVLASWLLDEHCDLQSSLVVCIVLVGVLLVTQPPLLFEKTVQTQTEKYTSGSIAALLASLCEAIGNISLRELKAVPSMVVLFNYSVLSCLVSGVYLLFCDCWTWPSFEDYPFIIMLSFLTFVEQYLMVLALSIHHAGPVALIQASDIIYGYIFEVAFYGEELNSLSLMGAFIVGVAVIYMALKNTSSYQSVNIV